VLEPDLERITLGSLHKAVGVEYRDRVYFALPVGSTENNQIWYMDISRKNLWVLKWDIAAKDMWLYEDNDGGTHFCVLVNNKVLEFTRAGSVPHQDDNVAWTSRIAFESMVWDEDGIIMAKIRRQYYKFLFPKGTIATNTTGLTRSGVSSATGSDSFTTTTSLTGIGAWLYSDGHKYGEDPGVVNSYGKSIAILEVRPKGLLAQLDWTVTSSTKGTDYILSAVSTKGFALDELVMRSN